MQYPLLTGKRPNALDLLRSCATVVDLLALLATLVRPWEVHDWDEEEGVAGIGNTGEGIVPERTC